jgi:hypothetical protein
LSWRRLGVLLRWLPPGSAFHRAKDPDGWAWGLQEQLTANVADAVNGGNWQRSGGRGHKPKPIPRPGVGAKAETFKGRSVPLDEMKRRFAERKAQWMADAEVS